MIAEQNEYLFTSERLGFRGWKDSDLASLLTLNNDPSVMRYFPSPQDADTCQSFINRMQTEQVSRGHCYWAVERKSTGEWLGFIGLHYVELDIAEGPFTDLGYRLKPDAWGEGLATEGSLRCLTYAKNPLGLNRIYAIAPLVNENSIAVMTRVGMQAIRTFKHPLLSGESEIELCALYQISV